MTVFLVVIFAFACLGWRWSASLPTAKLLADRAVLALIGVTSLVAVAILWSAKPQKSS